MAHCMPCLYLADLHFVPEAQNRSSNKIDSVFDGYSYYIEKPLDISMRGPNGDMDSLSFFSACSRNCF